MKIARKKTFFIALFALFGFHFFAQKDSSKIQICIHGGYDLPLSGTDFTKYYSGNGSLGLNLAYKIHGDYSIYLRADYCKFKLNKLNDYVADRQSRLLVNAAPYTDLIGGSIQTINFEAGIKKFFALNSKIKASALLGASFSLLEKRPVDGTDSTATYQILEHYVNETAVGINIGFGLDYSINRNISIAALVKYRMLFDTYVTDKYMGILSSHIGLIFKL
jgi:hypothetical protein